MQLVLVLIITLVWKDEQNFGVGEAEYQSGALKGNNVWNFGQTIVYICLVRHLITYCTDSYRDKDLSENGKYNKYRLLSAPTEFKLRIFECIMEVAIVILVILHWTSQDEIQLHGNPVLNYGLMIEMIMNFLQLPYFAGAGIIIVEGEITKNIFTLYQVQKALLKSRREADLKSMDDFKNFFEKKEVQTTK
jgi:hypothetical protein